MSYAIQYQKQALKDISNLKAAKLDAKVRKLINVIRENPYQNPPPYEKLNGDLTGLYSRRINLQHRLVYMVNEQTGIIRIIRMWTHYE